MAHHHHQRHHATTCNNCYCTCSHQSPPQQPPVSSIEPFIQALASQIFLLQQQQQQQSPQLNHSTTTNQHQNHKATHLQHHNHNLNHHQPQQQQRQQEEENDQTKKIISSLVARIDSLEASLYRLSASTPSSSPSRFNNRYSSIRDVAARTVQTYFREFLVRRSRTLGNLKDLAAIKSAFVTLKSLVSEHNYFNPEVVSGEAMDLLFELDSIQGGDPMIRDGKRAISKDLVRFLDIVDGVSVKRRLRTVKNLRSVENRNKSGTLGFKSKCLGGKDQREVIEKIRKKIQNVSVYDRVLRDDEEEVELEGFHHGSDEEHIARVPKHGKNGTCQTGNKIMLNRHSGQSRVKKCVSFAENGNNIKVFSSKNDTSSDDSGGHDEQFKCINSPGRIKGDSGSVSKVVEDDEELQTESGQSDQTSDSEENPPRKNSGSEDNYVSVSHHQDQNGKLNTSAPLPVKIESRADMVRRERLRKFEVDG